MTTGAAQQPQPGDVWALADGSGYLAYRSCPVRRLPNCVHVRRHGNDGQVATYNASMTDGAQLLFRDGKPVPQQEAS